MEKNKKAFDSWSVQFPKYGLLTPSLSIVIHKSNSFIKRCIEWHFTIDETIITCHNYIKNEKKNTSLNWKLPNNAFKYLHMK
jgi:hypothetical protein